MNRLIPLLILVILLSVRCSQDTIDYTAQLDATLKEAMQSYAPDGQYDYYLLPKGHQYKLIPQEPDNPLTSEKVKLGQMLFFESAFSTKAKYASGLYGYSCATCHIPEAGFGPNRVQGIADGGWGFGNNGEDRTMHSDYSEDELDIQGIRPLSLINVAFVQNTFWNGQFGGGGANIGTEHMWDDDPGTERNTLGLEALETQNIEGLKTHRMHYSRKAIEDHGYKAMFDEAFPDMPDDKRYSNTAASYALSAYLRSIVSDKAPFQDWIRGDSEAMTTAEKEGALLFFGKANCKSCHYEKNLGSAEFHALGTKDMDQHPLALNKNPEAKRNLGRGGFTGHSDENFCFKVPGLYNVSDSPFYFHGASRESLEDVVRYKADALRENIRVSQLDLSPKLHKIELTDAEVDKLVLFLSHSLRDPDMTRYKPATVLSGNCFPNNDMQSRMDLDCN